MIINTSTKQELLKALLHWKEGTNYVNHLNRFYFYKVNNRSAGSWIFDIMSEDRTRLLKRVEYPYYNVLLRDIDNETINFNEFSLLK